MQLVDEDDELVTARADLVHELGEALFEVAAVAGSCEHPGQVDCDHALAPQLFGHCAVDDGLREAFDDGGLADACLADEHRVVLGAPGEDLDGLLDLVEAADHGVELSVAGERGQVGAELVEHRGR